MSETLHTRYRPQKFEDIVGQGATIKAFRAALKNRTSHAFLLGGPSGCGKTTAARVATIEVECNPRDVLEIDAATYTGIDDMRSITSAIQYQPFGGKIKCVIIDECHALSSQAWKALLKSIEEPPEWMYWFLCTTELNKVPETIKTRCTRFELKPVGRDLLFELVKDIAAKEKFKASKSDGVLELCANEANGSPRQAIVNLGLCSFTDSRKEAAELLKSAAEGSQAFELAKALLARNGWPTIQRILVDLKDENPESIRQVVRGYITTVILGTEREDRAGPACEILDAFGTPFPSGDGISPVVLACAKVMWS